MSLLPRAGEDVQLSALSADNGTVRCGVGRKHALAQSVRNVCSAVERDPQKHDDTGAAAANSATVAASIRGRSESRQAEWLATAGLFKAVDGPGGAAPAPWVLEATVTELYGDFEAGGDNPAAVMSIRFTIIDEGSARPKVAYERSLSRRVPVSRAVPEALVSGYGRALADILTQVATDLSNSTLQ